MRTLKIFPVVVLGYLLCVGLFQAFQVAATCNQYSYPVDRSRVIQRGDEDNCGETAWELVVVFGEEWDEGEYDGTGACTGGYIDCACHSHAESYVTPSIQFESVETGPLEYEWWWDITNYQEPILNPCTSGACESTGYNGESLPTFVDYDEGWDDESCLN